MGQLVEVKLRGFQSHKDSTLNLGPGLNVITGPSDSGKTAIIRAVRWVAFNEPSGEAFVNKQVGEAEVTLTLDNGVEIRKLRKSGKTRYWVTGYDEPFEKAEVPLEVTQALGIDKQTFGDFTTALNFAYQLEAPFIISETASAGAKILGKIAGTEVVDMAIKDVGKDTYAARQERSAAEKDIARINGDLLHYQDLEDQKQLIEASEYLIGVIDETLARKERLAGLRRIYSESSQLVVAIGEKLDVLEIVPQLQQDLEQIEKTQRRADSLRLLQSDKDYYQGSVDGWEFEIQQLKGITEAALIVEAVEASSQRLAVISNLSTLYQRYTSERKTAEATLEQIRDLSGLSLLIDLAANNAERSARLKQLAAERDYSQKKLDAANGQLDALKSIDEANSILAKASETEARSEKLKTLRVLYRDNQHFVKVTTERVDITESELAKAGKELEMAWDEAGGICPLCDQPHERGFNHA